MSDAFDNGGECHGELINRVVAAADSVRYPSVASARVAERHTRGT
jgi:hypothetical protein